MDDARNTITNLKGKIGVLPRSNLHDFARVICSTDRPNIYVARIDGGDDVGLRKCEQSGLTAYELEVCRSGKEKE